MAPSHAGPCRWAAFDGMFDGTFDVKFDGMFDGMVHGMFDGMFDGVFDGMFECRTVQMCRIRLRHTGPAWNADSAPGGSHTYGPIQLWPYRVVALYSYDHT